ncbi:MAG: thioredoxin family protein [Verrucomicrobia bacterium]|nr:thioredoxin family protein [Verrucomicrobiota bacterium]
MKTILKLLSFTLLLSAQVYAGGKSGWDDNYEKALLEAKAEKKLVLLDFTGSDWCGWCMKLDDEVFSKSDFKKFAKENLVLVELDFPHGKRLQKKTKEQNEALKTKFAVSGFPNIIIVDSEGKEQARWSGYSKDFLTELKAKLSAVKP